MRFIPIFLLCLLALLAHAEDGGGGLTGTGAGTSMAMPSEPAGPNLGDVPGPRFGEVVTEQRSEEDDELSETDDDPEEHDTERRTGLVDDDEPWLDRDYHQPRLAAELVRGSPLPRPAGPGYRIQPGDTLRVVSWGGATIDRKSVV